MKLNKKGFTLIESIVTVAIIAIVLSAMAMGFSYIIHYMGESSLIKSTSNNIFATIQSDDENIESKPATMRFNDQLVSVIGVNKVVTENYNDKDELSLSMFDSGKVQDNLEYTKSANFFILINPSDKGNEEKAQKYEVNDEKAFPNYNCVVDDTYSSTDPEYIASRIKLSDGIHNQIKNQITMWVDANIDGYKGVNSEYAYVIWYKISKNTDIDIYGADYNVYGVVEPYRYSPEDKIINFKFIKDGQEYIFPVNSSVGFKQSKINEIKQILNVINDSGKQWSVDIKVDNEGKIQLTDLLSKDIFDKLNDGETVIVQHIGR